MAVAQNMFDSGGREIVTYIQYGYYLEVDIEVEGLKFTFRLNISRILRNVIVLRREIGNKHWCSEKHDSKNK